jgi:hypothetical protein
MCIFNQYIPIKKKKNQSFIIFPWSYERNLELVRLTARNYLSPIWFVKGGNKKNKIIVKQC